MEDQNPHKLLEKKNTKHLMFAFIALILLPLILHFALTFYNVDNIEVLFIGEIIIMIFLVLKD